MKNKFVAILFTFIFFLNSLSLSRAEEFIFKVTDLEILENGKIYKGNNRGKITTDAELELESDNFIYLKESNQLEANGDVEVLDIANETIINAEKIFYLKNENIIYTVGKTFIKVSDKYNIEGENLTLLRNTSILFSRKKATITDKDLNIYNLDNFEYTINQEILKGSKVKITSDNTENKANEYSFETAFFDLKNNKFLAKDVSVKLYKEIFDNKKNDPRINSVSGYGDGLNTFFEKGIFTSCKKTDKCPPWKMTAQKIQHDKANKQIIYSNAWLELYDFPVAYFPKFFHPDPTVKRQSGLLMPEIGDHDTLGDSIYLPYFFVLSDEKDLTIKPRLFNDNKILIQSEYRQKTKNSRTIADFSITKGHSSNIDDKKDSRSHFFSNTIIDLKLESFINSKLELNYESTSNDTYLKLFDFMESPLIDKGQGTLESIVKLDLAHEDYDLIGSFEMYETLSGTNSDRFQYTLPSYNFSKNFNLEKVLGSFNFYSQGNNTLSNTNVSSSTISNDLKYKSYDTFFDKGIKTNYEVLIKNVNSVGKNSLQYKNSPQSELISAFVYNTSLLLRKNNSNSFNTLEPKLSFKLSPHDMKNNSNESRRIDVNNVFNTNRLGLGNSFESGESLTLGLNFKNEKINTKNEKTDAKNELLEIDEYFDIKLATVLRIDKEDNIPVDSTINGKSSNFFGGISFTPNKNFMIDYDFSLSNDLNNLEYNNIDTRLSFNNFTTQFKYLEERGVIGQNNIIENNTQYNFNNENSISFGTRRNRKLNLTEYYNLIYEYKNDCLIANIRYNKKYYNDADIKPIEELFFSLTIVPFYTFSPNKVVLKQDRVD